VYHCTEFQGLALNGCNISSSQVFGIVAILVMLVVMKELFCNTLSVEKIV
jgi:hypothetical protein